MEKKDSRLFNISARSFAAALVMLLILMVLVYALTYVLPSGAYERAVVDGREVIVPDTYHGVTGNLTMIKWLLSPVLSLTVSGGGTAIAIIVFIFAVGGAFTALDESGILSYMLGRIHAAFAGRKYVLLPVVSLFFMLLGAFVGSFEEVIPLVPLVVALAYSLGWDALTGLGMSLLSVGCGFSTGVCNPFTVGVAQRLADVPMFSGVWFRLLAFALIYGLLMAFLLPYARRIEREPARSPVYDANAGARWSSLLQTFKREARRDRALVAFAGLLGFGVLAILLSSVVAVLQSLIMPLIAVVFLAAGVVCPRMAGMEGKAHLRSFLNGVKSILPGVLLILMANSISYTMNEAAILDTILYQAVQLTQRVPDGAVALMIYALVLLMNLFIASGSAKAFLLMPLLTPLADLSGLSRQVTILAFAFGDGFSNVFYPTNPVLLVSLGIVGVGYGTWARWSAKIQLSILALTAALVMLATAIGY